MTHEDLLAFMNNKYDRYFAKSEDMEMKLNKVIMKKIATLRENFIDEQKKNLIEHIVQGGGSITLQEIE
jgi:polynucleotide 5'-kinase involved in rRNA processing